MTKYKNVNTIIYVAIIYVTTETFSTILKKLYYTKQEKVEK